MERWAETSEDELIGEFQVAEYLIFLFALDTYLRYSEETTGQDQLEGDTIRKGVTILRLADHSLDSIKSYLDNHLPSPTHKMMLNRAINISISTANGVARRALQFRTLLSRGGPSTMKGIFDTTKYIRQVREAISASMLEDADRALDIFAALPMRNTRMRAWIDLAAKVAGSGEAAPSAVDAGSREAGETSTELVIHQVQQIAASGADESLKSQEAQAELLDTVEREATNAARRSLEINSQSDEPPTRSEVVGVAVAAATAAMSDPSKPQNIPTPLRRLDDEQRAAALTDGKVRVAAGAGSGKTSTVVARVEYLIKERRVLPSRILVTSFNNKASEELKERLGKAVGGESLQQMSVGTMHSLFKRFIGEYGTNAEKVTMGQLKNGPNGFIGDGKKIGYAVQNIWEDCYGKQKPIPKLQSVLLLKAQWAGNHVTPLEAAAKARSSSERDAALWYEMYEGLKGSIPGWKPVCHSKSYESFMTKVRPNNIPLGDFSDMLSTFLKILKREPRVQITIQKMYDHIIVDEAQDRNSVMKEVLDLCAGHVTDGSDGKSYWVVGDDKQAINSFQGACSELFINMGEEDGWKTRSIRTNYRCEPELVDAANKLIAHNKGQIEMESVPNPQKVRGSGSIQVVTPMDEARAALGVVESIKQNLVLGANVTDHAVLTRTNKELHAYETACIIRGVPYARKGASSFLGSPETSALLGYVQLVTGSDFTKMQKALGNGITKPRRFFLTDPKKAPEAVEAALSAYARQRDVDVKSINPMTALQDRSFVRHLVDALAKLTRSGKAFKFEEKIEDLAQSLQEMKALTTDPDYTTKNLFDDILGLKGTGIVGGAFVEQSFRESLQADLKNSTSADDDEAVDEDDEEDSTQGLGNISFLYQLALPDPTDEDDELNPPTTPMGFKQKMERYASKMKDLRTDITKWYKEQSALPPEKRSPPPGVYLGTCHSTKGAQWPTVFVAMPAGKFPMVPIVKPGEEPPPPEEVEQKLEDERRLAYVAITRAAKNLTIVCPSSVGGKAGGVSEFVYEAGLNLGQNIKPAEPNEKQAFDVSNVDWQPHDGMDA